MRVDTTGGNGTLPGQTGSGGGMQAAVSASRPISPIQRLGFYFLLAFLFLVHSRIFDVHLHFLRIPILTYWSCVVFACITGGVVRAFSNRIGLALLAFTGWLLLATAGSVWVRGSVDVLQDLWLKVLLIYLIIAALISGWDQFRGAMHAMAYSIIALSLVSLVFGDYETGRLFLPHSRFANPNDLAQILLMGLPFCWFIVINRAASAAKRALAFLGMIPILAALAKTGSRGALVGFAALVLFVFLKVSLANKIKLAISAVFVLVTTAVFLPDSLRQRYLTLFESRFQSRETVGSRTIRIEESATSSAHARWYLFKRSLELTMYHPLLGVGPGMFAVGDSKYAEEEGERATWQVTHNTFTQVSSEAGIPALLLYLGVLYFSWKAAGSSDKLKEDASPVRGPARRPGRRRDPFAEIQEIKRASFCLKLSLFSYTLSAMFASLAYNGHLLTLAGLCAAFAGALGVRAEKRQVSGEREAAGPAMQTGAPAFAAGIARR